MNPSPSDLLPHRPPFLFVDRLEECTKEKIVGYRLFRRDESFFTGHFPEYPVVPGVLLVEAMAQCGGAGLRGAGTLGQDRLFFLASIRSARFRRPVRPEEEIRMEITTETASERVIRQSGKAFVGETVAAEATWMCVVGEKKE